LDDAAECFARADRPEAGSAWRFGALGWRGLLADLRGRRAEALGFYRAALAIAPDRPLRHDQYKITMDRAWVEERLKKPFAPGEKARVPERPTATQLVDFVDALGWEKEGETPLLVYRKAAGLAIRDARFWLKLGLLLYDSRADKEGLAAFLRMAELETSGLMAFTARVWQGHMNDLLRNRPAALECYRAALKLDPGTAMKHSQWGMTIDRAWVEERLRSPFTRK
jgi:tetratricopeptide (TPR) repeat protein